MCNCNNDWTWIVRQPNGETKEFDDRAAANKFRAGLDKKVRARTSIVRKK